MNVAVVGAGVIGQLRAKSIIENKSTTLAGVADADLARAAQAVGLSAARSVADYRSLVGDASVDAVIISTPVHLHEEMALAAFAAGKHVLCEKPLSNTVESCRRILDAARASKRTLAVGFNHRYYPSVKFMKRAIDDGLIGVIDHVRVFGGHDGLANFRADWMFKGALSGGGAMMDVGIHMTDLARYVMGEVREVYGVTSNRIWNVDGSEDNAMVILRGDNGVPAFYQATWTEWKGYRFFIEAYGDRGMVRAYYAPMFNLLVTQERPGAKRARQMKFYPEIILREKLKGWQTTTYLSFQEELADFLRMVQGTPVPLADGWSGVRAVEIAHAAYRSSSTGAPITLSRDVS
jgi:predicted dehydrogenase